MVRTQKPPNARARGVAVLVALAVAVTATIALQRPQPVAAQSVEDVMQEVNAAVAAAGTDPNALMATLPAAVTSGHGYEYQAVMSGDSATVEAVTAQTAPDEVADLNGVPSADLVSVVDQYAPGTSALSVEQQAVRAIDQQGSATWPYFKGEFLDPALRPPYGEFTPNCENNWCMPDLYRTEDYNSSNYCTGVPDLWFKWPCYQHDLGFTFAPRTSSSSSPTVRLLSTFFAVNNQWYSQMRHECDEQIRGYGPTWIFCQLVALTYYLALTFVAFPVTYFLVFKAQNGVTGYDQVAGEPADHRKPPVHLRWHGCVGPPQAQVGYTPVHGSATVNRGATLYLTGRTHRSTRALFEFRDAGGNAVANYITGKARTNCIIHHEPEAFSTWNLPVGTYRVTAWYYSYQGDGVNRYDEATGQVVAYGRPTFDPNVLTLTVTAPPPPPDPPPPGNCYPPLVCE